MPRQLRQLRQKLTEADLYESGPMVRLSDLAGIMGISKDTIIRAVDAGALQAVRLNHRPRSPFMFQRTEIVAWLERIGWKRPNQEVA